MQIAGSLQGVVTQALLPTADGHGRVPALEILLPDDAIRNLIRQGEGRADLLHHADQHRSAGMQTMEQALAELTLRHVVTLDAALARSISSRSAARSCSSARTSTRAPRTASPSCRRSRSSRSAPDSAWRRAEPWSTGRKRSSCPTSSAARRSSTTRRPPRPSKPSCSRRAGADLDLEEGALVRPQEAAEGSPSRTRQVEEQTLELDAPAAVELVQHYAPEPVAAEPHVELVPEPVEQVCPVAVAGPRARHGRPARRPADCSRPSPPRRRPQSPRAPRAEAAPVAAAAVRCRRRSRTEPQPPTAPAAAPVVVHPPVSAAELPRFPTSPSPRSSRRRRSKAPRVPFYKRDSPSARKPKSAPECELDDTEAKAKKRSAKPLVSRPRRLHGPAGVASTRSDSSA